MATLIGITGRKRHGKGSVARFAMEWAAERGMTTYERGFADCMKLSLARLFFPDITLEDAIKWVDQAKVDPTCKILAVAGGKQLAEIDGRQLPQRGGTEAGRDVHGKDVWVDLLLPPVFLASGIAALAGGLPWRSQFNHADFCMVSDMRFDNEAERVKKLGGVVWEVLRPGMPDADQHDTEQGLDSFLVDNLIVNSGTLDELRKLVFDVCDQEFGDGR